MPRKSKIKTSAKAPAVARGMYYCESDAAWGGYINLKLDDEQKNSFFTWFEDAGKATQQLLEDLLAEDAKVTFSYDRENQCHIISITGALVGNSNERYVVTSRAGTLDECLGLAVYKHFYLCDGDYADFRPSTGKMNNWG